MYFSLWIQNRYNFNLWLQRLYMFICLIFAYTVGWMKSEQQSEINQHVVQKVCKKSVKKTVQQECENSRCVDLFTFWYMFMHIYTFVIYAFHLQVLFALVFPLSFPLFVTFSTLFCIVHVFLCPQLPVIHFKSAKIWCKKLEEFTHVFKTLRMFHFVFTSTCCSHFLTCFYSLVSPVFHLFFAV